MNQIKPIAQLSAEEIRALAHATAERGDDMLEANVFEPGTPNHMHFRSEYLKREFALSAVA